VVVVVVVVDSVQVSERSDAWRGGVVWLVRGVGGRWQGQVQVRERQDGGQGRCSSSRDPALLPPPKHPQQAPPHRT